MAAYISGYAFTTLGVGPFAPRGNLYRLLFVVEGAVGFATFTLAITSLLAVLSVLRLRNSRRTNRGSARSSPPGHAPASSPPTARPVDGLLLRAGLDPAV